MAEQDLALPGLALQQLLKMKAKGLLSLQEFLDLTKDPTGRYRPGCVCSCRCVSVCCARAGVGRAWRARASERAVYRTNQSSRKCSNTLRATLQSRIININETILRLYI